MPVNARRGASWGRYEVARGSRLIRCLLRGDVFMSHTPGPWNVARTQSTHSHPTRFWETLVESSDGLVAVGHGLTHQESDANAALVAAAPELLAALKTIAENSAEENEWDAVEKLHANETLARAAIAKAEGR